MDITIAAKEIGYRATRRDIKNMVKALSLHPWGNTAAESVRLEAGKTVLKHWNDYQLICNSR